MSAPSVVEVENLSKVYRTGILGRGRRTAVEGVTFQIGSGEVFGLLGPNRAGKTTIVKVLLSLCRPTSGRVARFHEPTSNRRTLSRVGYVHENPAFPRYLTPRSLLHYFGGLALIPEPVVRQRTGELLERVGLSDRSGEAIATFSKGMVQRLALAQALMNDPELLVLDEPGEGLDLEGRRLVHEVIAERRGRHRTVLLVTHIPSEIERLCDRLAVIVAGKLAFSGTVSELCWDPTSSAQQPVEAALDRLYRTTRHSSPGDSA